MTKYPQGQRPIAEDCHPEVLAKTRRQLTMLSRIVKRERLIVVRSTFHDVSRTRQGIAHEAMPDHERSRRSWTARNVETLKKDDTSMYNLYRRLIEARRRSEALKRGSYHLISAEGDVLLYVRALGSERMLIILNLGATPVAFVSAPPKGIVLVSTSGEREGELIDLNVQLGANEGLIIKLAPEVDLSSIEPGFQNPMSPPVIHANNP